jgi:TonB family protein
VSQGNAKVSMTFNIYQGQELVRTEELTQDIIKVGKLPSSHLRIDDENVSRMHAVIEVSSPEEIYIIDLGSASGTVVNGKKVNKCKLESGDEIVLGDTRVVVEITALGIEGQDTVVTAAPSVPPVGPGSARPSAPSGPPNPFGSPVDSGIPNPFAAPAGGGLPNPFAAPVAATMPLGVHGHGHADEDPDKVSYGMVASGPPVMADEVETGAPAVEVVVMWGDRSVLHVEHLSPPRDFYVGEGAGVGFMIGSEVLGTERMAVVTAAGYGPAAVIPPGATGTVTVGDQVMSIEELRAGGKLQPSPVMSGAEQYVLPQGATARIQYKGFTFVSKGVSAGRKVVGSFMDALAPLLGLLLYIGAVAVFAVVFLTILYFSPPMGAGLNFDVLDENSRLVQFALDAEALQEEELPEFLQEQNNDDEGGKGKRHKGEEGQMGKKEAKKTNNRYGIEGPEENPDPHMAREEAREQARTAGILGVLQQTTGAWNSPTSPFGRDTALGNDPMSALGALMGDQIGENFGFGGLGLRGTGRGGGGTGEGTIGLGNLGTIGHGAGGGSGSGYGRGAGGFSGREARVPQIRSGAADVRGSLSREVIRRVIQRHINEVRFCYEQELNQRPDLEGRVTVSFIISPAGAVQSATVANSTMGNSRVESCISGAVRRWSFPAPEGGGIVVVNYPFMLSAAGG